MEWSNTATGRMAPILAPRPGDVCIADIAYSLSRQCRFGGHLKPDVEFYSVAQHCVLVSRHCKPEHALIGLLHDAAEAYVHDIVRPVKRCLGQVYAEIEARWALAIGLHFGLQNRLVYLPDDVCFADRAALATERRDLIMHMNREWNGVEEPFAETITPLRPIVAYRMFMNRFEELTTEHPLSVVP